MPRTKRVQSHPISGTARLNLTFRRLKPEWEARAPTCRCGVRAVLKSAYGRVPAQRKAPPPAAATGRVRSAADNAGPPRVSAERGCRSEVEPALPTATGAVGSGGQASADETAPAACDGGARFASGGEEARGEVTQPVEGSRRNGAAAAKVVVGGSLPQASVTGVDQDSLTGLERSEGRTGSAEVSESGKAADIYPYRYYYTCDNTQGPGCGFWLWLEHQESRAQ